MSEVEFICISCWESFSVEEAKENDDDIVCPHCGAKQNGMPEDQMTGPMPITIEEEAAAPTPDEDVEEFNIGEATMEDPSEDPADEDPAESLAEIDPSKATWRLKSGLGLTYNFVGIEAVLNWASGKKGLDGMQITVEDTEIWKEFESFTQLIRKNPPLEAFYASEGDEVPAPQETSDAVDTIDVIESGEAIPEDSEEDSDAQQSSKKKSRFSDPIPENLSTKKRQTMTSPGIRTTGEFTFRMAETAKKSSNAPILVLMGFLLGAGSFAAIWLFGLLPAAPFGG